MPSRLAVNKALEEYLDEVDIMPLLEIARKSHRKGGMRTVDYCICGETGSSNASALCRLLNALTYTNMEREKKDEAAKSSE